MGFVDPDAVALRKESVDRNDNGNAVAVSDLDVALRKESVDRNPPTCFMQQMPLTSLSARRAWIEMQVFQRIAKPFRVALRKESVDRNYIIKITVCRPAASLSARRAWIEIGGTDGTRNYY